MASSPLWPVLAAPLASAVVMLVRPSASPTKKQQQAEHEAQHGQLDVQHLLARWSGHVGVSESPPSRGSCRYASLVVAVDAESSPRQAARVIHRVSVSPGVALPHAYQHDAVSWSVPGLHGRAAARIATLLGTASGEAAHKLRDLADDVDALTELMVHVHQHHRVSRIARESLQHAVEMLEAKRPEIAAVEDLLHTTYNAVMLVHAFNADAWSARRLEHYADLHARLASVVSVIAAHNVRVFWLSAGHHMHRVDTHAAMLMHLGLQVMLLPSPHSLLSLLSSGHSAGVPATHVFVPLQHGHEQDAGLALTRTLSAAGAPADVWVCVTASTAAVASAVRVNGGAGAVASFPHVLEALLPPAQRQIVQARLPDLYHSSTAAAEMTDQDAVLPRRAGTGSTTDADDVDTTSGKGNGDGVSTGNGRSDDDALVAEPRRAVGVATAALSASKFPAPLHVLGRDYSDIGLMSIESPSDSMQSPTDMAITPSSPAQQRHGICSSSAAVAGGDGGGGGGDDSHASAAAAADITHAVPLVSATSRSTIARDLMPLLDAATGPGAIGSSDAGACATSPAEQMHQSVERVQQLVQEAAASGTITPFATSPIIARASAPAPVVCAAATDPQRGSVGIASAVAAAAAAAEADSNANGRGDDLDQVIGSDSSDADDDDDDDASDRDFDLNACRVDDDVCVGVSSERGFSLNACREDDDVDDSDADNASEHSFNLNACRVDGDDSVAAPRVLSGSDTIDAVDAAGVRTLCMSAVVDPAAAAMALSGAAPGAVADPAAVPTAFPRIPAGAGTGQLRPLTPHSYERSSDASCPPWLLGGHDVSLAFMSPSAPPTLRLAHRCIVFARVPRWADIAAGFPLPVRSAAQAAATPPPPFAVRACADAPVLDAVMAYLYHDAVPTDPRSQAAVLAFLQDAGLSQDLAELAAACRGQALVSCLARDMQRLLTLPAVWPGDLILRARDGQVSAHRAVLMQRTPELADLVLGAGSDNTLSAQTMLARDTVVAVATSAAALHLALYYAYTGVLPSAGVPSSISSDVYALATAWGLADLAAVAEPTLESVTASFTHSLQRTSALERELTHAMERVNARALINSLADAAVDQSESTAVDAYVAGVVCKIMDSACLVAQRRQAAREDLDSMFASSASFRHRRVTYMMPAASASSSSDDDDVANDIGIDDVNLDGTNETAADDKPDHCRADDPAPAANGVASSDPGLVASRDVALTWRDVPDADVVLCVGPFAGPVFAPCHRALLAARVPRWAEMMLDLPPVPDRNRDNSSQADTEQVSPHPLPPFFVMTEEPVAEAVVHLLLDYLYTDALPSDAGDCADLTRLLDAMRLSGDLPTAAAALATAQAAPATLARDLLHMQRAAVQADSSIVLKRQQDKPILVHSWLLRQRFPANELNSDSVYAQVRSRNAILAVLRYAYARFIDHDELHHMSVAELQQVAALAQAWALAELADLAAALAGVAEDAHAAAAAAKAADHEDDDADADDASRAAALQAMRRQSAARCIQRVWCTRSAARAAAAITLQRWWRRCAAAQRAAMVETLLQDVWRAVLQRAVRRAERLERRRRAAAAAQNTPSRANSRPVFSSPPMAHVPVYRFFSSQHCDPMAQALAGRSRRPADDASATASKSVSASAAAQTAASAADAVAVPAPALALASVPEPVASGGVSQGVQASVSTRDAWCQTDALRPVGSPIRVIVPPTSSLPSSQ